MALASCIPVVGIMSPWCHVAMFREVSGSTPSNSPISLKGWDQRLYKRKIMDQCWQLGNSIAVENLATKGPADRRLIPLCRRGKENIKAPNIRSGCSHTYDDSSYSWNALRITAMALREKKIFWLDSGGLDNTASYTEIIASFREARIAQSLENE